MYTFIQSSSKFVRMKRLVGEFPVEFRGDGFNHFVCKSHSAHAHWDFHESENKVLIDWGNLDVIFSGISKINLSN